MARPTPDLEGQQTSAPRDGEGTETLLVVGMVVLLVIVLAALLYVVFKG